MYYINYFFIMSILGHFIKSFFSSGNSGILFSYWTPIYGVGTIIILLVNKYINKFKFNRFFKIVTLFLCCSITLSAIESTGGYLIKLFFNKELWNYSNHLFNIGKYTSLEMSIVWGVSSIIIVYLVKPIVDKYIYKIPKIISLVLISLFILDLTITILFKT